MEDRNKKIKLPAPNKKQELRTIRLGNSEFEINTPDYFGEIEASDSIKIFEKALKEKTFSELETNDCTDK